MTDKACTVSTTHLFDLVLHQRLINELGVTPLGRRRVVDIEGGHFSGERLRGTVRRSGQDAALVRGDEVFVPDVTVVMETDDDALVLLRYTGRWRADPGHMDRLLRRKGDLTAGNSRLRVFGLFETSAPQYAYLNELVAVGIGVVRPAGIDYAFHEVL